MKQINDTNTDQTNNVNEFDTARREMNSVRQFINPVTLSTAYFDEYGAWSHEFTIHNIIYRVMIIRDSEGLYTLAITPRGKTVEVIDHVPSLPGAVARTNELLSNIDRHDVTVIGSGERMRVLR